MREIAGKTSEHIVAAATLHVNFFRMHEKDRAIEIKFDFGIQM